MILSTWSASVLPWKGTCLLGHYTPNTPHVDGFRVLHGYRALRSSKQNFRNSIPESNHPTSVWLRWICILATTVILLMTVVSNFSPCIGICLLRAAISPHTTMIKGIEKNISRKKKTSDKKKPHVVILSNDRRKGQTLARSKHTKRQVQKEQQKTQRNPRNRFLGREGTGFDRNVSKHERRDLGVVYIRNFYMFMRYLYFFNCEYIT